jgi:hypothetical protein
MMEAVSTFEMLVYSNETTWRYIPEDSHIHTRRRENLKAHKIMLFFQYEYEYLIGLH